jgi:4-amino-4-deoxy-L-arabinose transferase-like glycosyltransferase
MSSTPPGRALAGAVLLALVAGALFFQDLGRYPLLDPDEARHAEVAREMTDARGVRRVFLPTLDLQPYREKPAGYYWLVALAHAAAGPGEAAARSVSALAALLSVLALYAYALPRFGLAGALGAGLVATTSAGWFAFARYANLDMTLTACVTAGVLSGLAWLDRPAPRRPPLAPYVAAGLGTLVKGPLAVVLTLGPLALAAALRRPRPAPTELGLARGALVMAVIAALLYVPVGVLDRSYLAAFAATNLRRWGTTSPHAAPVHYYFAWIPALLLPWTLLGVPALVRAWRDPGRRPLLAWAIFVPALLTLPRGKLATYALSGLVPLALLIGPELARATVAGPEPEERRLLRAGGWLAAALLLAVAVLALVVYAYPVTALGRLALAAAALGWAGALAVLLRMERLAGVPLAVLGAMLTLYPVGVRTVAPAVGALHSNRTFARLVAEAGPAPVIAFAIRDPSLTLYLGTPAIHTDDAALVRDLFQADGPAFLVTSRRHFAEVDAILGERARVWHETRRRRLYGNRPPTAVDQERNGSR